MSKRPAKGGLPTREQILEFIQSSDAPAGKREIAKAFALKGADKVALKALLKDMGDAGRIRGRRLEGYAEHLVLVVVDEAQHLRAGLLVPEETGERTHLVDLLLADKLEGGMHGHRGLSVVSHGTADMAKRSG